MPVATNDYQQIRKSYQSTAVAGRYDSHRFEADPVRQSLNRRLLVAVTGVLNAAEALGRLPGWGQTGKINSILDMPCGTGRLFPTLLNKGYRITGSDISREMMQVFGRGNNAVPLVQCDATRLPYKDGSFDAVTCVRFLTMRVPKSVRAPIFREMCRVSRAWVVIECRQKHPIAALWFWIAEKIFRKPPVVNYFRRDEIKQELSDAGIRLVRIFKPFGFASNKWLLLGRTITNKE
jgi:SAM-dependent methyltransferase